jgi:hypothetical protein
MQPCQQDDRGEANLLYGCTVNGRLGTDTVQWQRKRQTL